MARKKGVIVCAKIRNFRQITTAALLVLGIDGCDCLCKDKKFSTNHNEYFPRPFRLMGVNVCAKIRNFRQITTYESVCSCM